MNELDLSNTQAVIFMVVLIGLLIYLNHRDRERSSESLSPDYGRYIQLAGVNKQGDIK